MRDFVFENKAKIYFGGPEGVRHAFTDLTSDDVEKIYRMCL